MNNINTDEAAIWVEVFPNATPKELIDFLHGIDDCLQIQKSASLISRFDGKRVARKGWNGANMFAYIVPANSYPAQTGAAKSYFGENPVPYRQYWALKTAQDDVATWAPSGSDSLAEDWMILD